MNNYEVLEKRSGAAVYFAHPYHFLGAGLQRKLQWAAAPILPETNELREYYQKAG